MSRRLSKSLRCMLVFVMCFALGVFAAGCGGTGDSSGDGDAGNNGGSQAQGIYAEAEKAAEDFMQQRLEEKPYSLYVESYEMGEFIYTSEATDDNGNTIYEVDGTYKCTFGCNENPDYLTLKLAQKFQMKQNEDGSWTNEGSQQVDVLESSADTDTTAIKTLEETSFEPFLSRENAEGMDTNDIGNALVMDLMMNYTSQADEARTFFPAGLSDELDGWQWVQDLTSLDGISDEVKAAAKNVWLNDGGIAGVYVGYIDGVGFEGPLFVDEWEKVSNHMISQSKIYMVEKEDGYYMGFVK